MSDEGPRRAGWGVRALAVVAVGVLHLVVLRPLRPAYVEHVVGPLVRVVEPGPAVLVFPELAAVRVAESSNRDVVPWSAPPGTLFLIPAVVLAGVFPRRPYWAVLLGYHVALSLVQVVLLAWGASGPDAALGAYAFSRTYLTHGVALAGTAVVVLGGRAGRLAPGPAPATERPRPAG